MGLLEPTLGLDKSETLVLTASRELVIPQGDEIRVDHVLAILDRLGEMDGIAGVAARFVRARGELDALIAPSAASAPAPALTTTTPGGGVAFARPAATPHVPFEEIAMFVAPALGDAVARASVAKHAAALGIKGYDATRAEAAQILDGMSKAEGILGIVASFAKARFILKYPT